MAQWGSALAWSLTDNGGGKRRELEMLQPRKWRTKEFRREAQLRRKWTDIILYIKRWKG